MGIDGAPLLALGQRLGIDGLRLNADGLCELVFDGGLRAAISATAAHWVLAVQLGPHPLPPGDPALGDALRANFLWQATQGATLALDGERRLWAHVALAHGAADGDALLAELERLLDTAERWQQRRPLAAAPQRPQSWLFDRA